MRKIQIWFAGPLAFVAALFFGASCNSLFGLDEYDGAADSLCELLVQCFGAADYPDCMNHVGLGLETASAEERNAWLQSFSDNGCLQNCTTAKQCLDQSPVCLTPDSACAQNEHCCGFVAGTNVCEGDRCCQVDGTACASDADCCGSCSPTTKTCGGVVCGAKGSACGDDGDCCSKSCDLQTSTCLGACLDVNESCSGDAACCSKSCVGGVCTCRQLDEFCSNGSQCCSGICTNGQCSLGCQGPEGPCGPTGPTCCDDIDGLGCTDGRCCVPNGFLCPNVFLDNGAAEAAPDDAAYYSPCCGGGCREGLCCTLQGFECDSHADCCSGTCRGGHCDCGEVDETCFLDIDCCEGACIEGKCGGCLPPGCHSGCEIAPNELPPLDPYDNNSCSVEGDDTLPAACVLEVCEMIGECCCRGWGAECVNAVVDLSKENGSACAGQCSTIIINGVPAGGADDF